jgi:hypothetical protein
MSVVMTPAGAVQVDDPPPTPTLPQGAAVSARQSAIDPVDLGATVHVSNVGDFDTTTGTDRLIALALMKQLEIAAGNQNGFVPVEIPSFLAGV